MSRFAAYFLPVLLFLLIDHLLGRQPYSFANDNIPGQFGLGLSFATAVRSVTFHHPAFPIIEIAGVLASVFKDAPDLNGFFQAGRWVHVGFAGVAALWMAPLASLAGLRPWQVALLSLGALSMPTMALYAPLLVSYFPVGILLPPMMVAVYLLASQRDLPDWVAPIFYAVLGFQLSMLVTSLTLVLGMAAGLLWLLRADNAERLPAFRAVWPQSEPLARILLFVCLLVWFRNVLIAMNVAGGARSWLYSGVLTLAILVVPQRFRLWWQLLRAVVLPTLAGWIVGCNIMVLEWGANAHRAFINKGGAAPNLPLSEVWQRADIPRFLAAWHWHGFIAALAAALIALPVILIVHKRSRQESLPFVAIFAAIVLALTTASAADVSFLRPPGDVQSFGQESRYVFLIIAPVVLLGVAGFLGTTLTSAITGLIYAVLIALSFFDYYSATRAVWPESSDIEANIEEALQTHIAASPDNVVVCLRIVQPRQCAMLYGFNNYQSMKSLARYEGRTLENGKVRYAIDLAAACAAPGACMLPGRELFISESPPQTPAARIVLKESYMYVFQLTAPWPAGQQPQSQQR